MPLPLIPIIIAAVAGTGGGALGTNGIIKTRKAKKTVNAAKERDTKNQHRLEEANIKTSHTMDSLGKAEMETLKSFDHFSALVERIQNRPSFATISTQGMKLPEFTLEEVKKAASGAKIILGGVGGVALGTLGGFAAAGATTSAVMALGTAGTGVAISSLSGAAATNATLAAIGGGTLAAGGGGMAAGTIVLGAAGGAAALLLGGAVFAFVGSRLSKKADEALKQVEENERKINDIIAYLVTLDHQAKRFRDSLMDVKNVYDRQLGLFGSFMDAHSEQKVDWNNMTESEQMVVKNSAMLVAVLYDMCKVKLVKQVASGINKVNTVAINTAINQAAHVKNKVA